MRNRLAPSLPAGNVLRRTGYYILSGLDMAHYYLFNNMCQA